MIGASAVALHGELRHLQRRGELAAHEIARSFRDGHRETSVMATLYLIPTG